MTAAETDPLPSAVPREVHLASSFFSISLEEYFNIYLSQGRSFILVDTERRKQIMEIEGWEKMVYFEEIGERGEILARLNATTCKMYRLKDWMHLQSIKPEAKQTNFTAKLYAEKKRNQEIEDWKRTAREKLRSKGVKEAQVEYFVNMAINPADSIKHMEYIQDPKTEEQKASMKRRQETLERAFGFRKKLEFPEIKEEKEV